MFGAPAFNKIKLDQEKQPKNVAGTVLRVLIVILIVVLWLLLVYFCYTGFEFSWEGKGLKLIQDWIANPKNKDFLSILVLLTPGLNLGVVLTQMP